MKFTYKKAGLKAALVLINKVTNLKSTKPILGCVKIECGLTGVRLSATDLETTIGIDFGRCNWDGEAFTAVVDAKGLADAVKSAPGKEVEVEKIGNRSIKIAGAIELVCEDPDDFPHVEPSLSTDSDVQVPFTGERLAAMFRRVQFAVAKDMSSYAYNGILFESRGQAVGIDGWRLSISSEMKSAESADWSAIVPVHGFGLVAAAFKKCDEVFVEQDKNLVKFSGSNGTRIACRMIEGDFPKYEEVIPDPAKQRRAELDRELFQAAIEQAAALNKKVEVKQVKLHFNLNVNKITISTDVEGVGNMSVDVPVSVIGPMLSEVHVTFNPDFLLDWLKSVPKGHGTIFFRFEAPGPKDEKQIVKATCWQDLDEQETLYVVMPITS